MKLLLPLTVSAGILAGVSAFLANAAPAPQQSVDLSSASGLWEQYSDDDGKREGWFLIFEKTRGVYEGAIVKMFLKPGEDPNALRCTKCTGEQKNQPSLGLVIIKGMQRQGRSYENGTILDPRDGRTLLAAAKTGHLGPTVFRSTDLGRTWKEAAKPPAFAKAADGQKGRAVNHTFWLAPSTAAEPNVWYAGTSPQGLFRSEDGGVTWAPFANFHDDPKFREWFGSEQDGTPDGPKMHSVIVDPRDPKHLFAGVEQGGLFVTTDGGTGCSTALFTMDFISSSRVTSTARKYASAPSARCTS